MSEVKWTKEQLEAINCQISNTIVSAGAGSGKTAVLTERIFDHLSKGISIDRLLVLTFTKAAATSMKEKTKKKIIENKDNRLEKNFRKIQLDKIDGSYIMTFDAFALSLVKKYHYLLNVSNNISIIDENVLKIKQEEILEDIFNQNYASKNKKFIETISDLCIKNDNAFKEAIISINNKMDLIIDKKSFIDNYFDYFFSDDFIKQQVEEYRNTSLKLHKDIGRWLKKLAEKLSGHKSKFITDDLPKLKDFTNDKTVEELESASEDYQIGQMRITSEIDEETKNEASFFKEKIAAAIKEIKEIFTFPKSQDHLQIESTRKYVEVVLDIIKQLDEKTSEFKVEKDLYSYMDIAKMSIQVVKENENIKNEIRDYFKEILVDEYQDNSDLQEEFIDLISNDNVFVVGDIKQSIYGFRNANPLNFQNKYEQCKDTSFGKTVDLNKNFRSRKEVIDTVNNIFFRLMDRYIGGVNYDQSQAMVFGQEKYNDHHYLKSDYYQTEIISYDVKVDEVYIDKKGKTKTKKVDAYPFADKQYTKEEVEAMIIADDIKKKIKEKFQVFDGKELRDVKYGDFCIMAQTKKHFDLFNEVLSAESIPVKVEREVQIGETDIIKVVKRIFMLIDNIVNKKDLEIKKHCYASIERSFLIENNDENIYETIKQLKIEESSSYIKCKRIAQGIDDKSILEVFNEIVKEFDIYDKLHLIGEVELNVAILEYISSLALQLGQIGYNYSDFSEYLEKISSDENKKLEFKLNQSEDNTVKIMTIHNSKGLEFKICYYPLLFGKFNISDTKGDYLFSKERGIILPCRIYENNIYSGLSDTVLKKLFKRDEDRKRISEKIRLFYVALTRAQEKIIIICPLEKKLTSFDNETVENNIRMKYNSFLSMLNSIYEYIEQYVWKIDLRNDIKLSKKYLGKRKDVFENLKAAQEIIKVKDVEKIVAEPVEKVKFSKDIAIIDQTTKEVMESGTKLHYLMEVVDFKNPDYSIIDNKFKLIIQKFIESDLLKDVAKAKVIKEYEFIYQQDKQQKHGVIDLLLEYEDRFVVIDYKLKNISDEDYNLQLSGYKEYIESVSNKKVECYLYSLIDSTYRQVK
ncbi:MAG: UvrD-helicase domain-containing protein [Bacillota bacterium]|nr:UvrD-helicase domain-containing protein [Bacillota bacterium]NLL25811.1 UvrD-helicase domain-containing protein [Erysipelotrichia bacterium]